VIESKFSGMGRCWAVLAGDVATPIITPVTKLQPSQATCEQCHAPSKFVGDRLSVTTRFSDDERNTALRSAIILHVGGGEAPDSGIHGWHSNENRETLYYPLDDTGQEIGLVRVRENDVVTDYVKSDATIDPASIPDSAMRRMDCVDCHNRQAHPFPMPAEAVDRALTEGTIDRALPYVRMVTIEALQGADTESNSPATIARHIREFYQDTYPDILVAKKREVEQAIQASQEIYAANIFPAMNITWGTYTNNLGHTRSPGCFRCHDDTRESPTGAVISQDCAICHTVLAWDEEDPPFLTDLGIREK
jgi:formate-dependent nitrite reductase cytochrome c552 subunit